jgi:hypothetical protein
MRCWIFVTVHQQFVHIPFALRAAWRLTLPSLGYCVGARSLVRRGVASSVGINHWSRPARDIFKPLYLAQIELVFHDS